MSTDTFTNITAVKRANANAGRYWFSTDTIRALGSRVESRIYDGGAGMDYPEGSRLWVESMRNYDDTAREYKIAIFDVADGDISYVSARAAKNTILRFRTKAAAVQALEGLL